MAASVICSSSNKASTTAVFVADGHRLPVVVLVPLLDQPGAPVGLLVALGAGNEP
jgi:hypothetical protein